MTNSGPTDHQCLAAARRALAAHLATRPATTAECEQIASDHYTRAAEWTAGAVDLRQRAAAVRQPNGLLQSAGLADREALDQRLHGDAWARIAADPAEAYADTTRTLEARAARYQGMIDARRAQTLR